MVEDDNKGFGASGTNSSHVTAAMCRWKVEEGVHHGQLLSFSWWTFAPEWRSNKLTGIGPSSDHISRVISWWIVVPSAFILLSNLLVFTDTVLYKWLQLFVSLNPVWYNLTISPEVCSEFVLCKGGLKVITKSSCSYCSKQFKLWYCKRFKWSNSSPCHHKYGFIFLT